jgi:hypothetical protein
MLVFQYRVQRTKVFRLHHRVLRRSDGGQSQQHRHRYRRPSNCQGISISGSIKP